MSYVTISECRSCGSRNLAPILDMGLHPLANSLKKNPQAQEKRYPLSLVFCRRCSLLQLKETVKKEILFDRYIWVTGTSAITRGYADTFYKKVVNLTKIEPADLVLEIASNDGTFLKPFLRGGYRVIGVEPAKNIAALANQQGVNTINDYWDSKTARGIASTYGKPKLIIARNVIPHVSELHEVVRGIANCLSDEGIGVIEFHYAGRILKDLQYDSVYHEHLCYFSIASIKYLLNISNMFIFHIDLSPLSGGAYCVYFSKNRKKKSLKYQQLEDRESRDGVNRLSSWYEFAERCLEHRQKSRELLRCFVGKRIIGFGASARSSTYLNFCGFNSNDVKLIIDNNKLKQGFYATGTSIPIVSMQDGLKSKPDILLVLAWNFKNEIIADCEKNGYGGEYIIPFPNKPYCLTS